MSWPSASTFPLVAFTIPQMTPMSVVFPAPFGPRSAKISPRRISRLTFLSASKPEAYVLQRPATETIGSILPVLLSTRADGVADTMLEHERGRRRHSLRRLPACRHRGGGLESSRPRARRVPPREAVGD